MKVDVAGLLAATRKLVGVLASVEGQLAIATPLAPDTTSSGAAGRLDVASGQLFSAGIAQALALSKAATHLALIATKFASQEELNAYGLTILETPARAMDEAGLATLEPVPFMPPDVRIPLPPVPASVDGEAFSRQINQGDASRGQSFSQVAAKNAAAIDEAVTTIRQVAASVPDLWESPVGTAALSGRLLEHASALETMSDRWFELAAESRRHADDFTETVSATPKPQEFDDNRTAYNNAVAAKNYPAASQLQTQQGVLNARGLAEATRYAGITETTTSPKGTGTGDAPGAGVPAGAGQGGAPGGAPAGAAAAQNPAQLAKAAAGPAGEAAQAGQAGDAGGQMAQLLPTVLGALGGMAGGAAGMVGQIPQQLMQTGQGLMQAAQGMAGKGGEKPNEAELAKSLAPAMSDDDLSKGGAGGGAGGGVGDTHPAGALGPPVTPSTAHTAPTMPAGAPAPPASPTPTGGSAMGGMPMGMPMGGMMPHGTQGGDGPERAAADRKVVMPPQPHTEAVTGRVPDRTAAAAEAARTRAEADDPDDEPPRGPMVRRITLAPLRDDSP
jgi:hypothetical protein